MNSGVRFIDNDIRDRLMALGRLLIDQTRARMIIPPKQPSAGFWFGGGNLVRGADGAFYLVGRYRNYGDSRTGLGAGERGLELAIFRSEDECRTFEKVLSFSKSDLDAGARTVLSIEGSALEFTGEGVRLLVSSEKAGIPYPAHLADYHKPGTGVWTIEEMVAPAIDGLKNAPRRTLFASDVPEHLHVKDPFLMPAVHGRRRVGFCTHPFNWSSSNTCFAEQAEDGQWHMAYEAFPRGAAWDVAMTRATCLMQIPPMGVFKDRALQLLFYDGGECLRPLDAHKNAVLRPRGYSCEELGGLALVTSQNPFSAVRVSRFEALFTSPYGTGCSRYVDVLLEKDWAYATWQQAQHDGSQPLVMHAVPMAEIEKVLSYRAGTARTAIRIPFTITRAMRCFSHRIKMANARCIGSMRQGNSIRKEQNMIYRRFGKTGWNVSSVGLGTWNLGNQWGEMSDADAADLLRAAIDQGMNLLDTAESYGIPNGMSELRIGKTVTPAMRDKLFIVSKVGNWGKRTNAAVPKTAPDAIRLCGHACLGRMRTDRIDVLLCHEGDIEDPTVYVEGFEALRQEGHVREYGISTNSLDVLKKFYETSGGACAVVELDYSLLNRKPEQDLLPYCMEKDLGILVRGPLAKGVLSGRFDRETAFADTVRQGWNRGESGRAQYEGMLDRLAAVRAVIGDDGKLVETALRYVISHPANPVVIPGATKVSQVKSNAQAGAALLDDAVYQKLAAMAG